MADGDFARHHSAPTPPRSRPSAWRRRLQRALRPLEDMDDYEDEEEEGAEGAAAGRNRSASLWVRVQPPGVPRVSTPRPARPHPRHSSVFAAGAEGPPRPFHPTGRPVLAGLLQPLSVETQPTAPEPSSALNDICTEPQPSPKERTPLSPTPPDSRRPERLPDRLVCRQRASIDLRSTSQTLLEPLRRRSSRGPRTHPWKILPWDVQSVVFGFLCPEDGPTARQVCSAWLVLADRHQSLPRLIAGRPVDVLRRHLLSQVKLLLSRPDDAPKITDMLVYDTPQARLRAAEMLISPDALREAVTAVRFFGRALARAAPTYRRRLCEV